jgi:hypothetical protein
VVTAKDYLHDRGTDKLLSNFETRRDIGFKALRRDGELKDARRATRIETPAPLPSADTRAPSIDAIIFHVCRTMGLERADVASATRRPRVVVAREMIVALGRAHTDASYPTIADILYGDRSKHAGLIAAYERISVDIDAGPNSTRVADVGRDMTMKELFDHLTALILKVPRL